MDDAEEVARFDRMFGEGQWLWHEGCPAAPSSGANGVVVTGAFHHINYHGKANDPDNG